MNILMIHNYYRQRGGEGLSLAAEVQALRNAGHAVDVWTVDSATDMGINPLKLAIDTVWSRNSYLSVCEQLRKKPYDVLHVQNFFPLLSPSVYDAAKAFGIPVVQALRNYRLFCMQGGLFRGGRICNDCVVAGNPLPGIRFRCYRNSLTASISLGVFQQIHRIRKTWNERVDAYIAISHCVKEKYVEAGWCPDSIHVKYNTVCPVPSEGSGNGDFFAVIGRLAEDKGLNVLLEAWHFFVENVPEDGIPKLKIIGDGPLWDELIEKAQSLHLMDYIEFTGRLSYENACAEMGKAIATIQPSVRYEPFGRTVVESLAVGTPVVAAKVGGATELIEEGVSGMFFPAGDARALAEAVISMKQLVLHKSRIRKQAKERFDKAFSPELNAAQLGDIYRSVLGK